MAKNQVIYEKRRMSLFGLLFRLVIFLSFLSVSFIAGGVFLNDSFRGDIKSSSYYQQLLSYDYFNKLDKEATPKPKIVEKKVEKVVEKIVYKSPNKQRVGYQEIKPSLGINNFKKVESLNSINNSNNRKSLFDRVKEKINAGKKLEEDFSAKIKVPSNNSKASLNINKSKIEDLMKANQIELEEGYKKTVQKEEPIIIEEKEEPIVIKEKEEPIAVEEELIEVKEQIKVKPLDAKVRNLIESKAKIAKLDPISLQKLIYNVSRFNTQYGLDPIFITAIMMKESSLNPEAISANGKLGIFQIHPLKAKKISELSRVKLRKGVSLLNLDYNMALGGGYLNFLNKMFKGNKKHILTAYFMGIENFINAAKSKTKLSPQVINYRNDILAMYNEWNKINKKVVVNNKNKKVASIKPKLKKRNYYKSRPKSKTIIRDPFKTKNANNNPPASNKGKLKLPKIKLVN